MGSGSEDLDASSIYQLETDWSSEWSYLHHIRCDHISTSTNKFSRHKTCHTKYDVIFPPLLTCIVVVYTIPIVAPPVSPVVETSVLSATVPISLSWTLQPNLTGFQVSWELANQTRRRAVYGTGGGTSGQLPEDQNSYTINALRSGRSYDVTVTVFNPAGNSSTTLTQSITGG